MRLLGLDYGSKTVGVAVSDALGLGACGVEIIHRDRENKIRKTLSRIGELIEEYQVTKIVLGYPLNMDDSEGERTEKTLVFKEHLEQRFGLPVVLWDERLTTVEADEMLLDCGIKGKDRDKLIDEVAAILILRGYMEYGKKEQS